MKSQESNKKRTQGDKLIASSSLYQEFLKERKEILRHKWLESEKAGEDIGFERALLNWVKNHRTQWKRGRKAFQLKPF